MLPDDRQYRETAMALFYKYHAIEIAHDLTFEEKVPHMEEWWNKAHDLITDLKLHRSDMVAMAQETPLTYRNSLGEMIALCESLAIPILVFSAGIAGNLISWRNSN
jgi:5'-nucleotidase